MTCEEIQSLLLQGDTVNPVMSDGVQTHIAQCAACEALAARLRRLEGTAASLPPAPGSVEARARFEEKLRTMTRPALRHRPAIWRITPARVAVAAALLLASGLGAWAYLGNQNRAVASAETLDQLVAMNLSLSQSDSPDERRQLFAKNTEGLKAALDRGPLTDDDREVADALIKDGAFLADNHDPLAEADHFGQVADLLVNRMDRVARKSPKALDRLGKTYFTVVDRGINRNLERAQAGELNEAQKIKLEKVLARQAKLQARLERLLAQSPEPSKAQIRKSLDLTQTPRKPVKKAAKEAL